MSIVSQGFNVFYVSCFGDKYLLVTCKYKCGDVNIMMIWIKNGRIIMFGYGI